MAKQRGKCLSAPPPSLEDCILLLSESDSSTRLQDNLKKCVNNEDLSNEEKDAMWSTLHASFMVYANELTNISSLESLTKSVTPESANAVEMPLASEGNAAKDVSKLLDYILAVVHVIHEIISVMPEEGNGYIPRKMCDIVTFVPRFFYLPGLASFQVRNHIAHLAEMLVKKNSRIKITAGMSMLSFIFLLKLTTDPNNRVLKHNVERVWKFRNALHVLNLDSDGCKELVQSLTHLPENKNYLRFKKGRSFISFLFTINENIVNSLHESVKKVLPTCKSSEATYVGEIYCQAWRTASPRMRELIEDTCIQNFMMHSFVLKRHGSEMGKLGSNILNVLEVLHNERNRPDLAGMLANRYEPLIWRFLQSSNNMHRCNAAQVFFSAYPLRRPGTGGEARDAYEHKQHEAITSMLTDNCPILRIHAIKGVCILLRSYWSNVPPSIMNRWLSLLFDDLAVDSSKSDIRREVFTGIFNMLNDVPIKHLSDGIKKLALQVHDVNEGVRKIFFNVLIKLKGMGEPFWRYVPCTHLVSRLEVESPANCSRLVMLLLPSFYSETKTPEENMKQLFYLVLLSQGASRNMFLYSEKVLSLSRAVDLISLILLCLHQHVTSAIEKEPPEVREARPRKRRSHAARDKENENTFNESEIVVEKPENLYTKQSWKNPLVAQRMLDIAIILWHNRQLSDMPEEEVLLKHASMCIQPLVRYYKNTIVYKSVLHLASLVPLHIIGVTFHANSIVQSQLKRLTPDNSLEEVLSYVIPLCQWKRGGDIVEQAQDWLRESFAAGDTNNVRNRSLRKRVAFRAQQEPQPHMALHILNALFSYSGNHPKLIAKDYDKVKDLWMELGSIKELIIERLRRCEPLANHLLNDALLQGCMQRYAKLIHLLHNEKADFNSSKEYIALLNWAQDFLTEFVPEEVPAQSEVPLSVAILLDLLTIGQQMMAFGDQSTEFCMRIAAFSKKLLQTGCGIMFIGSTSLVIQSLSNIAKKSGKKDEMLLIRVVIPSSVAAMLSTLGRQFYSREILVAHTKNFRKVRTVLRSVFIIIESFFGNSSKLSDAILVEYADCLVNITANAQKEQLSICLDSLPLHNQLQQLLNDITTRACQAKGLQNCWSTPASACNTSAAENSPVSQNLLYLESQLISVFNSKASRGKAFVSVIQNRAKTTYQDEPKNEAYVSLLRALVASPQKLPVQELQLALKETEKSDDSMVSVANSAILGDIPVHANISTISEAMTGMGIQEENN